jgi:uncharacterized membrane protein YraQ (UPF0718 family)
MAQVHSHAHTDERSSYYLDQLFMIGVCGAIAGVTIMLWQSGLLANILHAKFHIWVALGGVSLLAIVFIRAVSVWRSVDEQAETEPHEHEAECSHDHGHDHDHGHSHSHAHSHAHSHGDGHEHGWAPWRYIVLLLPVLLYFLVLSNPGFRREPLEKLTTPVEYIQQFIILFSSIVWEALPFIVLGSVIAGMLEELLPQRVLASILPRNPYVAICLGGLLGLIFPMCECGIIPIMRRLLRKGLPLSCCIAYVLGGPIVNVVVLLSTVAAFSGMENVFEAGKPSYQMGALWMTLFRGGLGYITAVITAFAVERLHRKHGDSLLTPMARPGKVVEEEEENSGRRPWSTRLGNITETALHDFVDITVFLILGAVLAATVRMFLTSEQVSLLGGQYWLLAIVLMMGLAIALCLCSEADAFVAASFVTLRPSAKVAFLVLGPMLDFKLYAMYTRIFRPRLIFTIYTCVLSQVFLYSVATHFFWEAYAPRLIDPQQQIKPLSEEEVKTQATQASIAFCMLGTPAPGGWHLATFAADWGLVMVNPDPQIPEMSFLKLENAATSPELRGYFEGKQVYMIGRCFLLTERQLKLTRYKINCCAADATPLNAIIAIDPESGEKLTVSEVADKWVKVTGRIHFLESAPGKGTYTPALIVKPTREEKLSDLVKVIPQPGNPFIY